jgi:hypothetical protein
MASICNSDLGDNLALFASIHVIVPVISIIIPNICCHRSIFGTLIAILSFASIFACVMHYLLFYLPWTDLVEYCKWSPINITINNHTQYSTFDCSTVQCICYIDQISPKLNLSECHLQDKEGDCYIINNCCELIIYDGGSYCLYYDNATCTIKCDETIHLEIMGDFTYPLTSQILNTSFTKECGDENCVSNFFESYPNLGDDLPYYFSGTSDSFELSVDIPELWTGWQIASLCVAIASIILIIIEWIYFIKSLIMIYCNPVQELPEIELPQVELPQLELTDVSGQGND